VFFNRGIANASLTNVSTPRMMALIRRKLIIFHLVLLLGAAGPYSAASLSTGDHPNYVLP